MTTDNQLRYAVLTQLELEPSVPAASIGVLVNAGVVTLTGYVATFADKHAAESAAGRVSGINAIVSQIVVNLPIDAQRNDTEIASSAVLTLAGDVSICPHTVQVDVEQGWVTLSGEVLWYYQQQAAEQNIRGLSGVLGMSNKITIKSQTK